MQQEGYSAFCYGAVSITMPIVTEPFFVGTRYSSDSSRIHEGVYYYPVKMKYYTYDRLYTETRPDFTLPCDCAICDSYKTIMNVKAHDWNLFRRIHDVLSKDIENKMLRESAIPIDQALKDWFARSRVEWVQYIPDTPLMAF
jgi:hypothetical protein